MASNLWTWLETVSDNRTSRIEARQEAKAAIKEAKAEQKASQTESRAESRGEAGVLGLSNIIDSAGEARAKRLEGLGGVLGKFGGSSLSVPGLGTLEVSGGSGTPASASSAPASSSGKEDKSASYLLPVAIGGAVLLLATNKK